SLRNSRVDSDDFLGLWGRVKRQRPPDTDWTGDLAMGADAPDSSLEATLARALEKTDPSERADFLDRACGDDTELRQRVERRLLDHDRLGNSRESPTTDLDPE